jgi:glutathione peroxidase
LQGTHEQILDFVQCHYGAKDKVTWFEKGDVNGEKTREVYSFLKGMLSANVGNPDIQWNFTKFLIDHEGTPFRRYEPNTNPMSMAPDIEELIRKMEHGE